MEFLAHIKFVYPATLATAESRRELVEKEEQAVAALAEKGHSLRAWRVPGRREMWTLWKAKDANEFHAIIAALPLWPYLDLTVHSLAAHPIDPVYHKPTP